MLVSADTSGVTVNPGAALTLDNTGTNLANRVNDVAGLTLAGGSFTYLGAAGVAFILGAYDQYARKRQGADPKDRAAPTLAQLHEHSA